MENESWDICYEVEQNQAVYQYKNSDGSFREYSLDTPQINYNLSNKYLRHCCISPGMTIAIFDIPENVEVKFNLQTVEHSLAFSFFLTGNIEFTHELRTEKERTHLYELNNQLYIVKPIEGESKAFKKLTMKQE